MFSKQNSEENKKNEIYQEKIKMLEIAANSTGDLRNILEIMSEQFTERRGVYYKDPGTDIGANIPSKFSQLEILITTCKYYAANDEEKKDKVKELSEKLLNVVLAAIEERPSSFGRADAEGRRNMNKSLHAIFPNYSEDNITPTWRKF